ncbi:MAG: hypothetical protein JWN14_251 [Chthonomonadales bacterium]|nr:hypothetical protein [Chthonomonadales bacterium]
MSGPPIVLYTAGYRDAHTDRRLPPEVFYEALPPEAVTIDIRSHPYSPFAPDYTGSGVQRAVERWKAGEKTFYHLRELGNTRREASGKRLSPPVYVDAEAGFARLEAILREHGSATIFCACSYATHDSAEHRCHRFFVADTIAARMPELRVIHLEAQEQA